MTPTQLQNDIDQVTGALEHCEAEDQAAFERIVVALAQTPTQQTPSEGGENKAVPTDALEIIAIADHLRDVQHWAAQAGSRILAEIAGRMLDAPSNEHQRAEADNACTSSAVDRQNSDDVNNNVGATGTKQAQDQQASESGAAGAGEDEILALHRQLAAEKLRADQGWQRYESKNRECLDLRAQLARLQVPVGGSVDTPELRGLIDALLNEYWEPEKHTAALIAHIDAQLAIQRQEYAAPVQGEPVATKQVSGECPYLGYSCGSEKQCPQCPAIPAHAVRDIALVEARDKCREIVAEYLNHANDGKVGSIKRNRNNWKVDAASECASAIDAMRTTAADPEGKE